MTKSKSILSEIKKIVKGKDPDAKIYLYGSRVREEQSKESDWDVLILLNREYIPLEVEKEITYALFDLEFDTGELISPIVYSEKEWFNKYSITPFFNNVMKEGKLL